MWNASGTVPDNVEELGPDVGQPRGITVLGTPIGPVEYTTEKVERRLAEERLLWESIPAANPPSECQSKGRERWRWKPLLHTLISGICVLPGAFVSRESRGVVGRGSFVGAPRLIPHSVGGTLIVRLPNARTRTGKAQLSGHILEGGVSAFSLVCGGLSHP